MNMDEIRVEYQAELAAVEDAKQLSAFWTKFLSKGGVIQGLMGGIKSVPKEEKKAYGQAVNEIKNWAQALYDEKKVEIEKKAMLARYEDEAVDVTLPAKHVEAGNLHPLTCIKNEIIDVFGGMGFDIFEGPEIEDDDHNFTRLNVLKDHPSRDMQDTFWLTEDLLLRTHTSPGQVRVMDKGELPIKVLVPGKVFRSDSDATHSPMFSQMEGLVVDKRITLCDSNGNPLDADLSDVLVENHLVLVRIPVLMEKEISLLLPVIPGGGLTAADVTVEMSMNKIVVSGSPSIISKMPDTISLGNLDLSKENEDFSNREYSFTLPIGVKSNAGTTVYVSLTLPATETKELTILNEQIKVINAPEGYEASVGGKMTVTVRGKAGTLAGFDASDIQAVVDLKGSSEMGDYVIQFDIPENLHVGVIGEDQTAYVILTRKAA